MIKNALEAMGIAVTMVVLICTAIVVNLNIDGINIPFVSPTWW